MKNVKTKIVRPNIGIKDIYYSYIRMSQDFPSFIDNGQSIFDTFKETSAKSGENVDKLFIDLAKFIYHKFKD